MNIFQLESYFDCLFYRISSIQVVVHIVVVIYSISSILGIRLMFLCISVLNTLGRANDKMAYASILEEARINPDLKKLGKN